MKKVVLYTQPQCPPCEIVKMFLNDKNVNYKEINITTNTKARDFLVNELKSYSTPTVTVDDVVISGFNLEAISNALE